MKADDEGVRPKPHVCRRLFVDDGPADEGLRDNMFNQITEQINRNLDDACKKYNFDFRSEVPLEGDWTWERITPDDDGSQVGLDPLVVASDVTEPLKAQGSGPVDPEGALSQPPSQPPPADEPTVPQ